ncbi:F0F1 ATP synthase subunit epsilon [Gammaproteobacteria bacterium AS21]
MATTVQCDIVSAEDEIFSGEIQFVSVTGSLGELGIYPGHTPLLTELKPGPVELRKQDGEHEVFYVSGGFFEVQPTKVIVLADTALRAHDLDEAAAEQAKLEAEKAIGDNASQIEFARASAQLAEAAAQIRTLQLLKNKLK